MIALLQGKLVRRQAGAVIVSCMGVGYHAYVSEEAMRRLPGEGEDVTLEIHTHVREDALSLFGFFDSTEKEAFELLISVSGVGPKMAMLILSGLPAEALARALSTEDLATLTKISGVGKKTAERLVLELKSKAKLISSTNIDSVNDAARPKKRDSKSVELASALLNLGYRPHEVETVVSAVLADQPELGLEAALRESLKRMR